MTTEKTVSSLLNSLVNTPENFVAGKISQYSENWMNITTDRYILNTVIHGLHIQFESDPCCLCNRSEILFNTTEQQIIDQLLENFLNRHIVESTSHEIGEVISNIFIRPKPDGTYRLILNLSNLNEHIEYVHFKMETLKNALQLVKQGCYFAKIDLKDAYYSVPIEKESRKFLRFTWKGNLYQFTCLPNGLACGPRQYTKLMKPVFSALRKEGHINVSYIDDTFLQSETFESCQNNISDTLSLVDSLGLTTHPKKSILVPTQCIEFVGFLINSVDMTVRLTERKARDIILMCKDLLSKELVSIREFAQLIGKLVASEHGAMYAPLFYKALEIQKDSELRGACGNFDSSMILSQLSRECLKWWISNLHKAYKPISLGKPDRVIESDSSGTGFGARDVTHNQDFSGVWDENEKLLHINYLELKAAFMALKGLCSGARNEHIKLYLDNTTAIKYLSKMGGRKAELNLLTRKIWLWCIERNLILSVYHIPGILNVHSDRLSRQKLNIDMEWMLNRAVFDSIMRRYGMCEVDLFASSQNYQMIPYVSYLPDRNAMAINAFSLNWADYYSYIFGPLV